MALCGCLLALVTCLPYFISFTPTAPSVLEPFDGASQCCYELLRSFERYIRVRLPGLRYTLGAGTLLGAMRNIPSGLLQWEHDVDVYMPAKDASRLRQALERDCTSDHNTRYTHDNGHGA